MPARNSAPLWLLSGSSEGPLGPKGEFAGRTNRLTGGQKDIRTTGMRELDGLFTEV